MGIFKKSKKEKPEFHKKAISQFKESVKDLNELYTEAKTEYDALENVTIEFAAFIDELNGRLTDEDRKKMEGFSKRLNKVNTFAKNSVRDIFDVWRSQKKRLKEMQNES